MLALAACGPTVTRPKIGNDVPARGKSHAAATPCPSGDALTAAALAAWNKTAGTVEAQCAAMWVDGRSIWLVAGWWMPPEGGDPEEGIGSWTGLLTADGHALWSDGQDGLPSGAMDRGGTDQYKAVDLDGDGNDEVIYEVAYDHGGYAQSSLVAAAIRDDKLLAGKELPLSYDNSAADVDPQDAVTCQATYEVIDGPNGTRRVAITGEHQTGNGGDSCAPTGRHVYQWNGEALVEVQ